MLGAWLGSGGDSDKDSEEENPQGEPAPGRLRPLPPRSPSSPRRDFSLGSSSATSRCVTQALSEPQLLNLQNGSSYYNAANAYLLVFSTSSSEMSVWPRGSSRETQAVIAPK